MYYVPWMVDWPRTDVMRHLLPAGSNIALVTCRQQSQQDRPWSHVGIAEHIVESCALSNKTREIGYVFPLWLNEEGKRCTNLAPAFLNAIAERTRMNRVEPEDVLRFLYAQWHSPQYRTRFAELLRVDFPRVFLPRTEELFQRLAKFGARLIDLHLLRGITVDANIANDDKQLAGKIVSPRHPRLDDNRVLIDDEHGFRGVTQTAWDQCVGSYRACEKWLKDRRGRRLSEDDVAHYRQIVTAITATLELTAAIDATIAAYGDWPAAFVCG